MLPKRQDTNSIREWRKYRGLTLAAAAHVADSTAASLSRIERGEQPYSQPILEALARLLGCDPAELLMPFLPNSPKSELWRAIKHGTDREARQALALLRTLGQMDTAAD